MNAKLLIWVFLIGLAIHGLPASASAAHGPYFAGYGVTRYGMTPWDYLPGNTYLHVRNTVPYFALHPPVYYSHSVPRPYGYSPFADFPGSVGVRPARPASPRRVVAKPLRIINPYVVQMGDPGVTPEATMPRKPLRIINPYVVQPGDPGVAPEATPQPE